MCFSFFEKAGDPLAADSRQRREEGPLVIVWTQLAVDKDAISTLPGVPLKRKSNQIAEATDRHRVLTRKETIVRLEANFRPALHGLGDKHGAKSARLPCWD